MSEIKRKGYWKQATPFNEQYLGAHRFIETLHENGVDCTETVANLMKYAIIEDVAPVVHAHWNETFDYTGTCYAECSNCGLLWRIDEGTAEENEMFYCPKCSAKMDEVSV